MPSRHSCVGGLRIRAARSCSLPTPPLGRGRASAPARRGSRLGAAAPARPLLSLPRRWGAGCTPSGGRGHSLPARLKHPKRALAAPAPRPVVPKPEFLNRHGGQGVAPLPPGARILLA